MICSFLCLAAALRGILPRIDLTIDNFQPADVVRYPVVIVDGAAEGPEVAIGTSWKSAVRFPVVNHRFSALVELKPGKNMLLLHSGSNSLKFRLDYKPSTNPYKVYAAYLTAADGKETYYSTDPKDTYPIKQKFGLALKLLQAFTADAMSRAGYGRKTFSLELDREGNVVIHFVKSPKNTAELRSLDPNATYAHAYDVLKTEFQESTSKWCGLMGFTSFDPSTKKTSGHLALGGGSQACFGSGSMQWWPAGLREVPRAMTNRKELNPAKTFEDSGNRHTVWANVSTALGAILHELGHTFGLPHSPDPFSVMSRGFDFIDRSFCSLEPPAAGKTDATAFTQAQLTRWDAFFAARLNYSPWFQPDGNNGGLFETASPPKINVDGDDVVIEAPYGVRVAGAQNDRIPSWFEEFKGEDPPKQIKLSRKDLRAKMQDTKETFQIVVIDGHGQQAQVDDALKAGD